MSERRRFLGQILGAGCAASLAGLERAELLAQDVAPPGARLEVEEGGIAPRPARWYEKLPDDWVECGLCPRGCKVSHDERGTCGVRENRGGTFYTLVHSRPCSLVLDPVEKKPFFHVLPGAGALSVATPGCNLDCKSCQNWEIAQARPEQIPTQTLTPKDVVRIARQRRAPLVACTYTEPVVFAEYCFDIAVAGNRRGVKTVLVSNGYIQERPLQDLCEVIAAYKVDLKAFTDSFYRDYCAGELKPVLDTLKRLKRFGTWTEIVVLLIPTLNDSASEIRDLARFVRDEVDPEVPVHFTRFHPSYRLTNLPATPVSTLERARTVAMEQGLRFVYLGNVPGHPGENTYCPDCQTLLIRRLGMATVENRLEKGTCPDCHRKIPGIWS